MYIPSCKRLSLSEPRPLAGQTASPQERGRNPPVRAECYTFSLSSPSGKTGWWTTYCFGRRIHSKSPSALMRSWIAQARPANASCHLGLVRTLSIIAHNTGGSVRMSAHGAGCVTVSSDKRTNRLGRRRADPPFPSPCLPGLVSLHCVGCFAPLLVTPRG